MKKQYKQGVETRRKNGTYIAWNKGIKGGTKGSFKKGHKGCWCISNKKKEKLK